MPEQQRRFPNPFRSTLCVPHIVLYLIRFLWKYAQYRFIRNGGVFCLRFNREVFELDTAKEFVDWYQRKRDKRRQVIAQYNERLKHLDEELENRILPKSEHRIVRLIPECRSEMINQLECILDDCYGFGSTSSIFAEEIGSFLEFRESTQKQLYQEYEILIEKTRAIKAKIGLVFALRNSLALCLLIISLVAVWIEYALWIQAERERGNTISSFRLYQGYVISVLYIPGSPVSEWIWLNFARKSESKLQIFFKDYECINLLYFGLVSLSVLTIIAPAVTHTLPGLLVFIIVPIVVVIAICFMDAFNGNSIDMDDFQVLIVRSLLEWTAVCATVSQVLWSGGAHTWGDAFVNSIGGVYCEYHQRWIVFSFQQFTWRHWFLLFSWIVI